MNNNYRYVEGIVPMTGDPIWKIEDLALAVGGINELMQNFINKYNHSNYGLSIYDTITKQTIEIECSTADMPVIVDYIYHFEKGTPLMFIAINSVTDSYIVGMSLSRGRLASGSYKFQNDELIKI